MRSFEHVQTRGVILAATAALAISGAEAQAAPTPFESETPVEAVTFHAPKTTPKPVNQEMPLRLRGDEASSCGGKRAVSISLRGPRTIHDGINPHRLVVEACTKSARNKPYKIVYKNQANDPVTIKTRLKKTNKVAIPVRVDPVEFGQDYTPPILKAAVYRQKPKGKQKLVAQNGWLTTYRGTRKPASTDTISNCKPNPDFLQGIQDDNEFVYEESGIPRADLLMFAKTALGARVLRMNLIDGEINTEEAYKPFIETAQTAKALGYQVLLTIMQRPIYLPYALNTFSAGNFEPNSATTHTNEVMEHLGQQADYIEEGNEPNHGSYNTSSSDIQSYIRVQQAMTNAIMASPYKKPDAKILVGGMAPSYNDVINWLPYLNKLQAFGFSVHGYWMTGRMQEVVNASTKPVYVTEQGSGVTPHQAEDNRIQNAIVKCTGAKMSIQYQLIQRGKPWDTAPFSLAYVRDKIPLMK